MARAAWQLPKGVSRGTWNYVETDSIATDYDAYFADHPLLKLDMEVVRQHLPSIANQSQTTDHAPIIADFGCGTGRVGHQLAPLGYRILNVDLSRHMLAEVSSKSTAVASQVALIHANLVQLEWLRAHSLDLAVCLFSSLGMIRGREHRQTFLRQVHGALKPGAKLILHVHNRNHSWLDPHGPWWLVTTTVRSWIDAQCEPGDRVYVYRGLPSMFLHIYSRKELLADLRQAGFRALQIMPINRKGDRIIEQQRFWTDFRAGGFFAIARASDL